MAATARLLRTSAPLRFNISSSTSPSSSSSSLLNNSSHRCPGKLDQKSSENGCSKSKYTVKASVAESILWRMEQQTKTTPVDLVSTLAGITGAAITKVFRPLLKVKRRMSWKLFSELLIEKGVIDCRFFTMLAVAGSLLGSVLCYVEGFFLILESYIAYFQTMSKGSDEGHVLQLIIEAIDMFLAGSAMLVFGVGLYVMFVGTSKIKSKSGGLLSGTNFFGLFHLKTMPSWMGMQSVSQAKSQIGRSVLMMLQVGVLEKFKGVPIVTAVDLACFAGAVVISSACIFLLSKLSIDDQAQGGW